MSATYHYVATSAKPSAVSHAVVGHFTAPDELNLVIAKSTRLELHTITPDGLQPLYDVPVYGRIAAMRLVRLAGDARDTLVFTTERFQMVALQFDERTKQLRTVATGDLRDRIGRQIERGQIMTVDPLGRAVAMQFYDGAVKVRHRRWFQRSARMQRAERGSCPHPLTCPRHPFPTLPRRSCPSSAGSARKRLTSGWTTHMCGISASWRPSAAAQRQQQRRRLLAAPVPRRRHPAAPVPVPVPPCWPFCSTTRRAAGASCSSATSWTPSTR